MQDIAGECDIALRVLLLLLMKSSSAVASVVLAWVNGDNSIQLYKKVYKLNI